MTHLYADCFIDPAQLPADLIRGAEALVTGTLGLACEPTATAMHRAVDIAKGSQTTVCSLPLIDCDFEGRVLRCASCCIYVHYCIHILLFGYVINYGIACECCLSAIHRRFMTHWLAGLSQPLIMCPLWMVKRSYSALSTRPITPTK